MHFSWSVLDGVLGVVLLIIVVWAAFKFVTRIVLALILLVILAAVFFGLHFAELPFNT